MQQRSMPMTRTLRQNQWRARAARVRSCLQAKTVASYAQPIAIRDHAKVATTPAAPLGAATVAKLVRREVVATLAAKQAAVINAAHVAAKAKRRIRVDEVMATRHAHVPQQAIKIATRALPIRVVSVGATMPRHPTRVRRARVGHRADGAAQSATKPVAELIAIAVRGVTAARERHAAAIQHRAALLAKGSRAAVARRRPALVMAVRAAKPRVVMAVRVAARAAAVVGVHAKDRHRAQEAQQAALVQRRSRVHAGD